MNSHKTAIVRKTLPLPTRWLLSQKLTHLPVLDYGCGKCHNVNPLQWFNYDPFWFNSDIECLRGEIQTVVCNYVLCTLPKSEEKKILLDIQSLLTPSGVAYISVRNDKPKGGYGKSSRGTYQRKVTLPYLFQLRKTSQYRIYLLTQTSKLV